MFTKASSRDNFQSQTWSVYGISPHTLYHSTQNESKGKFQREQNYVVTLECGCKDSLFCSAEVIQSISVCTTQQISSGVSTSCHSSVILRVRWRRDSFICHSQENTQEMITHTAAGKRTPTVCMTPLTHHKICAKHIMHHVARHMNHTRHGAVLDVETQKQGKHISH